MERESAAFKAHYPEADIRIREGSSRDAISALFGARADLAVIGRELEAEERSAAAGAGLDLQGYRFARDALVIVVHPDNPVENISLEDLRGIYEGEIKSWKRLGGRDAAIVPVVQPAGSDMTEFFVEAVMNGETPAARSLTAADDSAVVAAVTRDPNAIGYVSLSGTGLGARPLRVSAVTGLSYWKPDLEAVYKGEYPLTRFHNFFVRADGARLAHGFITFVTSGEGQRLVHEAGLVPTTVPVRFVRRSPMLGSH
jgi:phosphate transport system substrate-binding protein